MINRTCLKCKKVFSTYPSRIRIGKGKYCSRKCSDACVLIKKGNIPWTKGKHLRLSPETEFKKGDTPWNKGKEMPSLKGHTHGFKKGMIPWNKNLKGFLEGVKHWNWKGGISKRHKRERKWMMQTFEYKLWRKSVFERDNYTCIWCGQVRGNIEADHIKSWKDCPELRFAIDNGRTLCHSCHTRTDSYGNKKNEQT